MQRRSTTTASPHHAIKRLCAWFDRHARDLPWRPRPPVPHRPPRPPHERSGYTALVAEAMLQQTQVARVIEHYAVFMRRFPNVRTLAAADLQEVLALWQGLGYYRRARSLHAAAQMIVSDFRGEIPATVRELRTLPGVGRYTAGAIASIVFGEREPLVDGNVQRVLARLFAAEYEAAARAEAEIDWTWTKAHELVAEARRPGVFNEAMMELGATICTPRAPRCAECPVANLCQAREVGRQDAIPAARAPAARTRWHHHAVVIRHRRSILLEQRPERGMWAGMWQTPTIEGAHALDPIEIARRLPVRVRDLHRCGSFDHHTTHRLIHMHVFTACRGAGVSACTTARRGNHRGLSHTKRLWRNPADLADLPLSNAQKKVLEVAGMAFPRSTVSR